MSQAHVVSSSPSNGARLMSLDGRTLPLRTSHLAVDAKSGLARVTLTQTFANPHAEPMNVKYTLALPADGAVSGFAFVLGERRIVGEVDMKEKARQRFNDAVLSGKSAALLDEERSSVFTQELGNVPPNTEVRCEITIDQRLAWLSEGAWEWRFPTVTAPRYLGAPGSVSDGAKVTVDVADRATGSTLSLAMSVRDVLAGAARPESPSHSLHTSIGLGRIDVTLATESGAALDRDVVVRWKVADLRVGVSLDTARVANPALASSAWGLITLVPPATASVGVSRDLILLLDTSGSMSGAPLDHARRVAKALIDSLRDNDQLELVEFSDRPRRWSSAPVPATAANRAAATSWLNGLRASGGTEMRDGIIEALSTLRTEAQRQVVLMTDGLIGGEKEVLEAVASRLPSGSRVHVIGIGSSVNRSLTRPVAQAGRGVELIIGIGEDVEPITQRILSRTQLPLITNVKVSGSAVLDVASAHTPDLFAASPTMLAVRLDPRGGELSVRGHGPNGEFVERLSIAPMHVPEGNGAIPALYAREAVEELELIRATKGNSAELDARISRLGLDHQISTRLTSWVAVSEFATVDPRAPKRDVVMPQNLPFGMSAEGVGLRGSLAQAQAPAGAPMAAAPMTVAGTVFGLSVGSRAGSGAAKADSAERVRARSQRAPEPAEEAEGMADDDGASGFVDRLSEKQEEARPEEPMKDAKRKEAPVRRSVAPPPPAAPRPIQQPARQRSFKGLMIEWINGVLVVRFSVEGDPLAWVTPTTVLLRFAGGVVLSAVVDSSMTTATGVITAGLSATLRINALPRAEQLESVETNDVKIELT